MSTTLQRLLRWMDQQKPAACSTAGWRSFQVGLFFLPTSALFAGLGLLGAISLWRPSGEPAPLQRPLARVLLGLSCWLLITMLASNSSLEVTLRLGNWVPFFWFLLATPSYLSTEASRKRLGQLVLVATVPALTLGLLQALLLFSGPWIGLGGLLNWELPARYAAEGAGVFANPNFTAAWYAMVLPLAAVQGLQRHAQQRGDRSAWILLSLLAMAIVLSGSRNALVGAGVGVLILAWRAFWKPVVALVVAQAALVAVALSQPRASLLGVIAQRLSGDMASKIAPMLNRAGSSAAEAIASGRDPYRSELIPQAIGFIQHHPWLGLAEPLLGWPAVQPPELLTHTHNVAFQLSIQHGLPAALLLVAVVGWLLISGWHQVMAQTTAPGERLGDRALLVSATIAVWLHAFDIPSFDSRNNMLGWLLLSCCWVLGTRALPAATRPTGARAAAQDG